MLTNDKGREIAMAFGPDHFPTMHGLCGFHALTEVGYERQEMQDYLAQGQHYKLLVFRDHREQLATWPNVLAMIGEIFPSYRPLIAQWGEKLATHDYDDMLQSDADPDLRSLRTLLVSQGFRRLYTGNGRTMLNHGEVSSDVLARFPGLEAEVPHLFHPVSAATWRFRSNFCHSLILSQLPTETSAGLLELYQSHLGIEEFVLPNTRIDTLEESAMADLEINIPPTEV